MGQRCRYQDGDLEASRRSSVFISRFFHNQVTTIEGHGDRETGQTIHEHTAKGRDDIQHRKDTADQTKEASNTHQHPTLGNPPGKAIPDVAIPCCGDVVRRPSLALQFSPHLGFGRFMLLPFPEQHFRI